MKILAINASYTGEKGYTQFLIDRLFTGARQAGAECSSIPLSQLKIQRCLSCHQCQTPEHHLQCVWREKDDAQMVFERMAQADLIVYATPIYVYTYSGLLKLLLERFYGICNCGQLIATESGLLFHDMDRAVLSKPFAAIICCDNFETETPKNAISYFKTMALFADAPLAGMLVRNAAFIAEHGKNPQVEVNNPRVGQAHAAFEQAGRELAQAGKISRRTQRRASQEFMPVPFFSLLKRVRFKPFKQQMVAMAEKMLDGNEHRNVKKVDGNEHRNVLKVEQ